MQDTYETETRTQLTADEQVRIAALTIAAAKYPNASLPSLADIADAIGEYILMGELPKPKPGTSY